MKRILMKIGTLVFAAVLFRVTYTNISSGRINSKFGGYITAADNPREFWFFVAFGVFVGVAFFICVFLKDEED